MTSQSQHARRPRVLITACEASADLYGGQLLQAVGRLGAKVDFEGLAGPIMQKAGCACIEDMTQRSAMLTGVLGNVGHGLRVLRRLDGLLKQGHFDAAVLIDSPTLNLPIAKRCKAAGVPVLYYVAPQIWAWAEWRAGKIRRRVDRLACILPFEAKYFLEKDIPATYVGHPLFDELGQVTIDPVKQQQMRGGAQRVVALLPGSRRQEIEQILHGQLDAAAMIARAIPGTRFLISAAHDRAAGIIDTHLADHRVAAEVCRTHRAEMLRSADLALVASGTVTLEVAYHRTPMIVMYNASRWMYQLAGRWLIKTKHLSLINILAGRELVPEFMPYYRSVEPIGNAAIELLSNPHRLERMRGELDALIAPIARPGASQRTAELLIETLLAQGLE